jgi:hypothetical protein
MATSTRGVYVGGENAASAGENTLDYITIASTGNATDFGNLLAANMYSASTSSSTRGVIMGGYVSSSNSNVIQYITMASTGNATDFGDLVIVRRAGGGNNNNIRAVIAGGVGDTGGDAQKSIDYFTIASTGNASDFGDLTSTSAHGMMSCSANHGGLH